MSPQERARRAVDQMDFVSRRNIEDAIVKAVRDALEEASLEFDMRAAQLPPGESRNTYLDASTHLSVLRG